MAQIENLWQWVVNLPLQFLQFFAWLTEPLPYLDISPLGLISFAGLTALIVVLLIRLVVGG